MSFTTEASHAFLARKRLRGSTTRTALRLFPQAGVRIVAGIDLAIAMSLPGALLLGLQPLNRTGFDLAA